MPLILNPPEARRPITLLWDPKSRQEAAESQERIAELCAKHFAVSARDDVEGQATLTPADTLDPQCVVFRVLTENGDDVIVWDRRDYDQILEARALFDDYLSRGYRAYVMRSDGEKGSRVDSFDALLETVIISKEGKSYEALLVPPTHPG